MTALCVFCSLSSFACGGDDPEDPTANEAQNGPNGNSGNGNNGNGKKEKEKEITTEGQALKVLLDFSDTQIDEANVGGEKTKTPEVKTLAEGIISDYTATIDRLKTIGADKGIKASKNGMSDRLSFNSKSQIAHISNVMPGMIDNAYITRVQNAHKEFVKQIDEAIVPILKDEDLKAEVATIREDANRHMADASALAELVQGEDTGLPPLGPGGGGAPFGNGGNGNGGPAPAVGPNGEQVPELNPNQMPGGAGAPGELPDGNPADGLDGGV